MDHVGPPTEYDSLAEYCARAAFLGETDIDLLPTMSPEVSAAISADPAAFADRIHDLLYRLDLGGGLCIRRCGRPVGPDGAFCGTPECAGSDLP